MPGKSTPALTGRDYLREIGYSNDEIRRHNMLQKEEKARAFYLSCEHAESHAAYTDSDANREMRGIDFRHDVNVEPKEPGSLLCQYQETDIETRGRRQTDYYTDLGVSEDKLGIKGDYESNRKMDVYVVSKGGEKGGEKGTVQVLKSTCRDRSDSFGYMTPKEKEDLASKVDSGALNKEQAREEARSLLRPRTHAELYPGGEVQYAGRPQDRDKFERVVDPKRVDPKRREEYRAAHAQKNTEKSREPRRPKQM